MRKSLFVALALSCLAEAAIAQTTPQERLVRSRAVEAAIWGMPVVNYDLMLQEMLTKTPGKVNQVIYWGKPLDWKNQTLTPNPDTLYFMTFLNTRDVGPIVIEIPPADSTGSLNANIVNVWQQPLEDAGLLGVDKGAGIKLLMLPPGLQRTGPGGLCSAAAEDMGQLRADPLQSEEPRRGGCRELRGLCQAGQGLPAVAGIQSAADRLHRCQGCAVRHHHPLRRELFSNLDRMVQSEPWLDRDRAMIDQLRSIGIEKGKPFAPDAKTKQALKEGVTEAHAWMAAKYDAAPPQFFEGTHWTFPTHPEMLKGASEDFDGPNDYPVDWRGITYHYAYIGIKRLGAGQFYLINIKDKDGADYDGAKTYRLSVPAGVPIEQYWSLTAYDRDTHALIKNVDRASRASNASEVKKNADGSVDIYVGAEGACRAGIELDTDRPGPQVRADVPSLRPEEGILRQGVEAAGRGGANSVYDRRQ